MTFNNKLISDFSVPQFVTVLVGTIGAISDGMNYGWTAPAIQVLQRHDSPIELSRNDEIWLESILLIGSIAGLPFTIYAVDKIGRKGSMFIASCISLIAWIVIAIASSSAYLFVARFMSGFSGDIAFVAVPMYIAEIADKKIRGFLAAIIYVMMLIGVLLIYSVAPYAPFYVPSIIGATILLVQIIALPFVPDSPYYLLSKDKKEKAKKHLQRLRNTDSVDKELAEMTAAMKRQKSEKGRPQDLFISKSNRKAVSIMLVLNGAQHLSGITVMIMNLHEILTAAESIYLSANMAGIIFAGIMLVSAVISDLIVDKFGRKNLLITSSLLTGLCIYILAIFFTLKSNGVNVQRHSWIPVASVMVYAGVFKFGLGIIPIVMTAELFPAKVKAMGMTIADLFYVAFAWLSVEIYQRLAASYGHDIPFYIFATSSVLTAIFAKVYIPETKGKTLEEIQYILKGIPFPESSDNIRIECKNDIQQIIS